MNWYQHGFGDDPDKNIACSGYAEAVTVLSNIEEKRHRRLDGVLSTNAD